MQEAIRSLEPVLPRLLVLSLIALALWVYLYGTRILQDRKRTSFGRKDSKMGSAIEPTQGLRTLVRENAQLANWNKELRQSLELALRAQAEAEKRQNELVIRVEELESQRNARSETQIAEWKSEKVLLEHDLENEKTGRKRAEEQQEELSKQVERLKSENEELRQQLDKSEKTRDAAKYQLVVSKTQVEDLETENDNLRRQLEEMDTTPTPNDLKGRARAQDPKVDDILRNLSR